MTNSKLNSQVRNLFCLIAVATDRVIKPNNLERVNKSVVTVSESCSIASSEINIYFESFFLVYKTLEMMKGVIQFQQYLLDRLNYSSGMTLRKNLLSNVPAKLTILSEN